MLWTTLQERPPGMADAKLDGNVMDSEEKRPNGRPPEQPNHVALKAGLERGWHLDPLTCEMRCTMDRKVGQSPSIHQH